MHPDLYRPIGHAYTESLGWVRLGRERGYALQVYAARGADPAVLAELGAIGLFSGEPASFQATTAASFGELPLFLRRTLELSTGCRQAWAAALVKPDVIFLPWVRAGTINGVADWLEELDPSERPRLALNVVRPERSWTIDEARQQASGDFSWFGVACRRLHALAGAGRLVFTAVEPRLAQLVSQAGDVECRPAPLHKFYPAEADLSALEPIERAPGAVSIGALGPDHTSEKGWAHLPEVIARVCAARQEAAFYVQVRSDDDARAMAEALQGYGGDVRTTIKIGPLSTADYFRRMLACDLVVQPYDDRIYALMPSGIFADAVICGTPVVAPSATWISDRLDEGRGAGVTFDALAGAGVAERIAEATVRAIDRLPELKRRAAGQGAAWRAAHSLEAFVDHVLARFDPPIR